eukprot:TRINITY_DN518_c0_g1_i7.p1 TRINITY_DN518_c0_g1~~TRINITY_DN518_c0_g1_i7.p1  ORF type:complete len:145 (+),score=8.22 TRINITY_DN518_c0_g1_i7:325-759(+)
MTSQAHMHFEQWIAKEARPAQKWRKSSVDDAAPLRKTHWDPVGTQTPTQPINEKMQSLYQTTFEQNANVTAHRLTPVIPQDSSVLARKTQGKALKDTKLRSQGICSVCKKQARIEFSVEPPSQIGGTSHRFCSKRCYRAWLHPK